MSNLYIGDKLNTHTPNTQVSLKALATPTKLRINMAIGIKSLKKEKKTPASPATSFASSKKEWDAMKSKKGLTETDVKAFLAQKNKEYQDAIKAAKTKARK